MIVIVSWVIENNFVYFWGNSCWVCDCDSFLGCWEVYLKLREGMSQIVKCVGVETPHCGNVEMW